MYEQKLAKFLRKNDISEHEILIELKKYREKISVETASSFARRQATFLKRRKDLQRQRLNKGFKLSLDYINTKIEKGVL